MGNKEIPRISGTLRAKSLQIPEVIWQAKGIVVMGRRMKSVLFSTDIAIIRNCNADAVLAVYPFTPQQIISQSIINASSIPVLVGVGGGMTNGFRSALIAKDAEAQGAFGVVVNAPMSNENIALINKVIDIPIIATVINDNVDIDARLAAGVSILNVSAASKTAQLVRDIRAEYPKVPIIATGGPTDETILETISAGANTISYTPPSTAEIFGDVMDSYRASSEGVASPPEEDELLINMLELL
ncbi:keto-hydroxyglutarate-aldolase/keto-deoxy-phosphogluconate aldolase [uncultured Eubacterium sp.]|uniref:hydrolase n=1 Tax=Emergencia sp. TaxID=1926557 RepID=UPI000820CDD4|nr:keto-hydroxyglutarate-aldolase/keto-deoxy-phosphogluconate aldolase [uncultured Eubacterium sp.]